MTKQYEKALKLIENEQYKDALKIARKRHGRDDINEYIAILDKLIQKDYLLALEEKGIYYQYYDKNHDNGDYGEKYFDKYLQIQPKSINVICDKAMSRFNKNHVDEALEYMDKAYEKYNSYSRIEKPRIEKKEVKMGKIELLYKNKNYKDCLILLNSYENQYGRDEKLNFYKGIMLQKESDNRKAIEYLDLALDEEQTLLALNSKGDAYYELREYKDALKCYKMCISHESEVTDNLELLTNFNYKAAYCELKLNNNKQAIKYLNKTISMLNEKGRLPTDIEAIYQKCSFKKEELLKTTDVSDDEFKKTYFFSSKTAIGILVIIIILYVILKILGY